MGESRDKVHDSAGGSDKCRPVKSLAKAAFRLNGETHLTDKYLVSSSLQLKVVIFQEGPAWVAQVLERDMAAHGGTPYAALAAIQQVLFAHTAFDETFQRPPLSRLKRAPQVY
jgi:hypothetical protein